MHHVFTIRQREKQEGNSGERRILLSRATVDAPWYINNDMIHEDLGIPTAHEVIHDRSIKHRTKLESHSNSLLQPLPRDNVMRTLKRRWPVDL